MTENQTVTTPTASNTDEDTFEVRRWRSKTVRVFAALDTMPQIVERILAVVGDERIMNKTATYVHSDGLTDLSNLDHATGLHKGGHAAYPEGHHVWNDKDQSGFVVYLTHNFGNLGTMEGFSANALAYNASTEKQVRDRHHKATAADADPIFDRRRDMTYIEITGRPGEPSRDDRIEIMDWNEHGVLRHTIITFVEPDYCDSGRVTETNYVILGHLTDDTLDPDATPTGNDTGTPAARTSPRPTHVLDTFAVPADPDRAASLLASVRTSARAFHAKRPNVDFAWVAEETVTRARKSI
jgi:hypothetical protein